MLACKDDTFYVGFSRYLHNRLKCHFLGVGAHFTRLHKPLRVLELRPANSEEDEFRLWCIYAELYGRTRVGGWSKHLCAEFNFTWPYPVERTARRYRPLGDTLFLPKILDTASLFA